MEIIRYTSPFDYAEILSLIEKTFGTYEANLELPQMNGAEAEQNTDWIYVAREGDILLGTVHATIPKKEPRICGVSGVCTTEAARGKGVAKALFGRMMADIDDAGVKVSLLGTGNPVAVKLYESFGFRYLVSSGVMIRLRDCDIVDFLTKSYRVEPREFEIVEGNADFRIPIIPLILHQGCGFLMDCNTNLVGRGTFSQTCCMSLYQRYLTLREKGGQFFGALDDNGLLGAIASVMPTDDGLRADFFCCKAFESAIPELLGRCEAFGDVYLQLCDKSKRTLAENLGYRATEDASFSYGGMTMNTTIYRK